MHSTKLGNALLISLALTFSVFLAMKLTGHVSWSWWWITTPLWVLPVLYLGPIVGMTIAVLVAFLCCAVILMAIVAFVLLMGMILYLVVELEDKHLRLFG